MIAQRATGLAERWRDELGVGLYLFGVGPRRQGWPLGWLIALGKPRVGRLQLVDHSDVGLALGALDGVAFEVAYVTKCQLCVLVELWNLVDGGIFLLVLLFCNGIGNEILVEVTSKKQ